jgi:hypothetical protein
MRAFSCLILGVRNPTPIAVEIAHATSPKASPELTPVEIAVDRHRDSHRENGERGRDEDASGPLGLACDA